MWLYVTNSETLENVFKKADAAAVDDDGDGLLLVGEICCQETSPWLTCTDISLFCTAFSCPE